jgi:hypothetical protein
LQSRHGAAVARGAASRPGGGLPVERVRRGRYRRCRTADWGVDRCRHRIPDPNRASGFAAGDLHRGRRCGSVADRSGAGRAARLRAACPARGGERSQRNCVGGVAKKTDMRVRGSSRDNAANATRSAGCNRRWWTCLRNTPSSWPVHQQFDAVGAAVAGELGQHLQDPARSSSYASEALRPDHHRESATAGATSRVTAPSRVCEPGRLAGHQRECEQPRPA